MMLTRWVSLLEGVLFSNAILNLHCNGSLSSLSSNLLINSTTRALFIFPLLSGLVKNTLEIRSFGDVPITTISFTCGSKGGSLKLSQRINSNCLKTGVTFSPLALRKKWFFFFNYCLIFICGVLRSFLGIGVACFQYTWVDWNGNNATVRLPDVLSVYLSPSQDVSKSANVIISSSIASGFVLGMVSGGNGSIGSIQRLTVPGSVADQMTEQ